MSEDDIRVTDVDPAESYEKPDEAGDEVDIEAPEADMADQHRPVREAVDHFPPPRVRDDVDPADAADQSRVVDYDEDDYR